MRSEGSFFDFKGENLKILVVEDSPIQRSMVVGMLGTMGHEVDEAASAEEALVKLKEVSDINCLITDLIMPGDSGVGLLKSLHDSGLSIPAIVLTADTDHDVVSECQSYGARAFLHKPVERESLVKALLKITGTLVE